ncbi:MAG: hypothetical protein EHM48_01465, partial [Planctomycetaceae bacterium]
DTYTNITGTSYNDDTLLPGVMYTYTVTASNENGESEVSSSAVVKGFAFISPTGSNSTANGDNGTEGNPWATLTYALQQIGGGNTFVLMDGTYGPYLDIPSTYAGTAQWRTVLTAQHQWQAVVNATGTSNGVQVNNSGSLLSMYTTVSGLEVYGGSSYGIKVAGTDTIIENNWTHHNAVGIRTSTGSGVIIRNNLVENNPYGIYRYSDSITENGLSIYGNIVRHSSSQGILLARCDYSLIYNNLAYDNTYTGINFSGNTGNQAVDNTIVKFGNETYCNQGIFSYASSAMGTARNEGNIHKQVTDTGIPDIITAWDAITSCDIDDYRDEAPELFNLGEHAPWTVSILPQAGQYGSAAMDIQVAYVMASQADIDGGIIVTGPNDYSEVAEKISQTTSSDGFTTTVTYRIPAPEGTWSSADAGTYTVWTQSPSSSDKHAGTFGITPEGADYTQTLPAHDMAGINKWVINWGDGSAETVLTTGNPPSPTHTYADGPSAYTITITPYAYTTYPWGTYTYGVNVQDVSPTLSVTGNIDVNEGSTYTLTLGSINDPGQDTVSQYIIEWGDGTLGYYPANTTSAEHVYLSGPGNYTIAVAVTDEDGTHVDVADKEITVLNVAPTVSNINYSSTPIDEDTTLTGTLTAATEHPGNAIVTYRIVEGEGYGPNHGQAVVYSDGSFVYTPDPNYNDINGSDSFTFVANDGTADSNTATVTITVDSINDAPTADDQSVGVDRKTTSTNSSVVIDLTATDVENDTINYTVPTESTEGGTINFNTTTKVATYTPPTDFEGEDSFTYTVSDNGGSNTVTVTITVSDAPVISDVGADAQVAAPTSYDCTVTFDDEETETCAVTWWVHDMPADVQEPQFSVNESADAAATVATFFAAGEYTLAVQVTDAYGRQSAVEYKTVTITAEYHAEVWADETLLALDGSTTLGASLLDQFGTPVDGVSVTWSLDRNFGTITNSTYTAPASGTATVVATGSIAYNNTTYTEEVSITVNVSAGEDITATEGSVISLQALPHPAQTGIAYSWVVKNASGDTVASGAEPTDTPFTFTPNDSGQYIAYLTVTDGGLWTASDTLVVTVAEAVPTASITLTSGSSAAEGSNVTVSLNYTNTVGVSDGTPVWTINWGDGTVDDNVTTSTASHSYQVTSPDDAREYFAISATVSNNHGEYAAGTLEVQVNNLDPAVPQDLIAIATDVAVNVSWDSADNANSYKLYRQDGDSITTILTSATSYSDSAVQTGKSYIYWVVGIDSNEHEGQSSNVAVAGLPIEGGPSITISDNIRSIVGGYASSLTPISESLLSSFRLTLLACNNYGSQVMNLIDQWAIDWGDGGDVQVLTGAAVAANNQIGHVYAQGNGNYHIVATATVDGREYTSNDIELNVKPNTPTSLTAVPDESNSILLSWTDNSNVEDGFSILMTDNYTTYMENYYFS